MERKILNTTIEWYTEHATRYGVRTTMIVKGELLRKQKVRLVAFGCCTRTTEVWTVCCWAGADFGQIVLKELHFIHAHIHFQTRIHTYAGIYILNTRTEVVQYSQTFMTAFRSIQFTMCFANIYAYLEGRVGKSGCIGATFCLLYS